VRGIASGFTFLNNRHDGAEYNHTSCRPKLQLTSQYKKSIERESKNIGPNVSGLSLRITVVYRCPCPTVFSALSSALVIVITAGCGLSCNMGRLCTDCDRQSFAKDVGSCGTLARLFTLWADKFYLWEQLRSFACLYHPAWPCHSRAIRCCTVFFVGKTTNNTS
jgi:hypothetical protein